METHLARRFHVINIFEGASYFKRRTSLFALRRYVIACLYLHWRHLLLKEEDPPFVFEIVDKHIIEFLGNFMDASKHYYIIFVKNG